MKLFRIRRKPSSFRRYINNDNLYIDKYGNVVEIFEWGYNELGCIELEPDEAFVEWSTGLTDRDDEQIYDGDILNWNDKITGEVRYDVNQSGFYLVTEGYNDFSYEQVLLGPIANECTVIGNVHGEEWTD